VLRGRLTGSVHPLDFKVMPKIRIHNRTKGTALPNGVVIVVRAGVTNSEGVFESPKEVVVQVGKSVDYDVSFSYAFRITAEPQNKNDGGSQLLSAKGFGEKGYRSVHGCIKQRLSRDQP
jgi:hypothetical protein